MLKYALSAGRRQRVRNIVYVSSSGFPARRDSQNIHSDSIHGCSTIQGLYVDPIVRLERQVREPHLKFFLKVHKILIWRDWVINAHAGTAIQSLTSSEVVTCRCAPCLSRCPVTSLSGEDCRGPYGGPHLHFPRGRPALFESAHGKGRPGTAASRGRDRPARACPGHVRTLRAVWEDSCVKSP